MSGMSEKLESTWLKTSACLIIRHLPFVELLHFLQEQLPTESVASTIRNFRTVAFFARVHFPIQKAICIDYQLIMQIGCKWGTYLPKWRLLLPSSKSLRIRWLQYRIGKIKRALRQSKSDAARV